MYEPLAEVYRALGDGYRLRILAMLKVRETCVCEMVALLPITQSAVSQHLRKLKQAGLVQERRQKYWIYYRLNEAMASPVANLVQALPEEPSDVQWLTTHAVGWPCTVAENGARKTNDAADEEGEAVSRQPGHSERDAGLYR
ncbi:MAG: ArsR family transcriptional regulator [Sulfobacillus thermosulfidooxidans]|nr:MAG: ArsR family transcriptional regulator [Sulfobacillus thermosulfidooxidans]